MEAKFVVVGGGIAGVTCAETLAFLNPEQSICLITKSRLIKTITNLVSVSKMLFSFDVEEKDACVLNDTYSNITIIYDELIEISSLTKTIITKNNKKIKYNYLCLCMGGQPKLIKENNPCVIGIRDTDSVQKLENCLKTARKVLIVGNGGIASELVHELKNIEIVWAVKDTYISATFLDPGAAQFFQNILKENSSEKKTVVKRIRYSDGGKTSTENSGAALGPDWHTHFNMSGSKNLPKHITIEYNSEINNIIYNENSDWPVTVELTGGKQIQCDFIISATGVTPITNIKIEQELKISLEDGGIIVNDKLMSSIKDVYAAGDVCTAEWTLAKHWFQMRLWTQARQMGAYAAKSMTSKANEEEILQDFCFEMFAHSTNLFGFKVALLGLFNGQKLNNQYECLVRITPNLEYIKLIIVEGRIQGAILIGETSLEETIENLILNQLDVTPYGEDLLNPDIDIEDYFD